MPDHSWVKEKTGLEDTWCLIYQGWRHCCCYKNTMVQ